MMNQSRLPRRQTCGRLILPVAVLLAVVACSNEQATAVAVASSQPQAAIPKQALPEARAAVAQVTEPAFKPEMLVRFPESSPVCITKEHLAAYLMHGVKGERTKAKALFVDQGAVPAPCMMIRPDAVVRVIGVEYLDAEAGQGLLEVALRDSITSDGFWTFTAGASPVANDNKAVKN